MGLSRRGYLLAGGTVLSTSVAGCQGRSESAATEASSGETERSGEADPLDLQFGETAVFTNDAAVELHVTPTAARLTEAVVVGRESTGVVFANVPDSADSLYLLVTFHLENKGSEKTKIPNGLSFSANGQGGRETMSDFPTQAYGKLDWLDSADSVEGTALFEVPADADSGVVSATFQTLFDSPPVNWTLDLASLSVTRYDVEGKRPGEAVELGTEAYSYSFAALGVRETNSYETGGGEKHTAADGKTFALVEVESENVGSEPVTVPTAFGMRLVTADDEAEAGEYQRTEERYDGGETDPGAVRTGEVLFELPESASEYTFEVELAHGLVGTWEL